jgi:F0F1-type ATP synthase assembly protein I
VREKSKKPESENKYTFNFALASVATQVGCFTVVLTLLAFAIGYFIDRQLGSTPWIALILMIGSVPLNLLLIYRITTKTTSKMVTPSPKNTEETPQKEEDLGRRKD